MLILSGSFRFVAGQRSFHLVGRPLISILILLNSSLSGILSLLNGLRRLLNLVQLTPLPFPVSGLQPDPQYPALPAQSAPPDQMPALQLPQPGPRSVRYVQLALPLLQQD